MTTRTITITSIIAAALLATAVATAGPGRKAGAEGRKAAIAQEVEPRGPWAGGPGVARFWERERVAERLGLTETQVQQLNAAADATEAALEAVHPSLKAAKDAMRAEMEKDAPNLDTAQRLGAEVHRLAGEAHQIRIAHRVAVKNILTAEQEDVLREGIRKHMGERRGHMERRFEGARQWLGQIGSPEELDALLDARGVEGRGREWAHRAWERRQERDGAGPAPAGIEAPLPPVPPRRR